jgi:hypothetical protein
MKKTSHSKGERGRDALKFRPSPASARAWLKRLDIKRNRLQPLPTTKVTEIIDRILSWKKEYPRDKCTIFTQWNHFAVILGVLLQKEKIKFVYITVSLVGSYMFTFSLTLFLGKHDLAAEKSSGSRISWK